ncbi:MAG: hypothetical protein LQ350_001591 [Teloschistes chrysophthalmus]|nr:MAG: hypothetical protein LQ350_001591 [Niorma chrysophthalma]
MFHRRRASSNPAIQPAKTTPTAAASTAAVQAFLNNRASNANLSNAAAAAALRSRPTTPTPVGQLPTKRRAQRSGSISSNGSARPTLQRQGSSGSMTERTFRDPSPKRGSTLNLYEDEPPPVPALPKGYMSPPPLPAKSLRRPASVEPPERVISPVPRAGGRGFSLDRGPGLLPGKQAKKAQGPALRTVGETDRTPNRDSVNFSRPMSPQNSSPVSPLREWKANPTGGQASAQAPTANMGALRAGEADNIQHAVQDAANRPVKKKKKAVAKEMVEGSHFAGAKPVGTALETPKRAPNSADSTPSPVGLKSSTAAAASASQPVPKKKKKKVVTPESSQRSSYASDSDSAMSDRPRAIKNRAAGVLNKQPSIVREDPEAEEQEQQSVTQQLRQTDPSTAGPPLAPTSKKTTTAKQHKKSASQPPTLSTKIDSEPFNIAEFSGAATQKPNTNGLAPQQSRPKSSSPGRAAHFLAQPMYETPDGIKHQPPARSVSPAKSAMKHSPSSRGASPAGSAAGNFPRLPGAAGSEASDNGSVVSDDGGRLQASKKKKSARVSFDEDSVVMGHASIPVVTGSPTILSPQHKDSASKNFLGFGRRNRTGSSPDDSDQDDEIEPTPTLPSFGSIRGRNRGEPASPSPNASEKTKVQRPLIENQTSSDQVVGHVLSQDMASRREASVNDKSAQQTSNDPLPPEVTSVEGTGYHSDNEESAHGDDEPTSEPQLNFPSASATIAKAEDEPTSMQNGTVPTIAILPATPGVGSMENEEEAWPSVPGGYRASIDDENLAQAAKAFDTEPTPAPVAEHHATDPTPAAVGISEPEPESPTTSRAGSPIVGHVAESIQHQTEAGNEEESDDTGNSIYSDAAEDVGDLEGDGFGSINAIIESPAITHTPFVASMMPQSPTKEASSPALKQVRPDPGKRTESELSEPAPEEGWDRAQAYWSGLSQSRKEQLEHAAMPSVADESSMKTASAPLAQEKPKKKKTTKKTAEPAEPPMPPWPDREFRQDVARSMSPKAGGMKQSMRSAQGDASQAPKRTTMRDGAPLKSSLRNSNPVPETKPVAQKASRKADRPRSAVFAGDHNKTNGKPAAGHGRAASVGVTPKTVEPLPPPPKRVTKPALRRVASDGSDSSSSFRKSKRPSTSDGGKYTMKRSMRGGSIDGRPQSSYENRPASSLSARSPPPSGRRPFSSHGAGGSSMRTSMRDSMDSSLDSRTKSPSRGFSFGRKNQTKAAAPAPKKTGSRFSSRFGDSSDEDDAVPKRQSRFVDSSDEEDKADFTPVRGIPRRIEEGDSTDLEDSSASPSPMIGANSEKPPPSSAKPIEGSALTAGSLRAAAPEVAAEKEKKKRSFFGGFGGSKKPSQPPPKISLPTPITTTNANASTSSPHPLEANYASPVGTPTTPRTPKAVKMLGGSPAAAASSPLSSQASPGSPKPKPPKLQRRNTPKRLASDSSGAWPLPEMPAAAGEKMRPSTSDGAGAKTALSIGTMRPDAGARRFTAEGQPLGAAGGVNGVGAGGKEGKKKRFPLLRKALGL